MSEHPVPEPKTCIVVSDLNPVANRKGARPVICLDQHLVFQVTRCDSTSPHALIVYEDILAAMRQGEAIDVVPVQLEIR